MLRMLIRVDPTDGDPKRPGKLRGISERSVPARQQVIGELVRPVRLKLISEPNFLSRAPRTSRVVISATERGLMQVLSLISKKGDTLGSCTVRFRQCPWKLVFGILRGSCSERGNVGNDRTVHLSNDYKSRHGITPW